LKNIFEVTKNNPLFQKIAYCDFEHLLNCLSAKTACYKKDEVILLSGDTISFVGLILSGAIRIIKEDFNGNITIHTELSVSDLFGEVFACAGIFQSPVTVQAVEDTEILFIDYKKIITSCAAACPFHARLIENMLKLIAKKNLMLNNKIEILSRRTTREKLQCFFDLQRDNAKEFNIPFNREELAHYLCVDRSAMSNELCKMRDEGLIKFQKNKFEILKTFLL
jgi:CRP-like cAMP-binding protein